MDTTTLLMLIYSFSTISSIVTEGIKNITNNKIILPDNLLALIVSLIIGGLGTLTYYQLHAIPLSINNIMFAIIMGLISGLTSMVGFDKVKQAAEQIVKQKRQDDF